MLEDLRGKTILVTGPSGFIGTHMVDRLRQVADARLLLLSRRPGPDPRRPGERWITASLAEANARTWREAGVAAIDVVFHLGGYIPKSASQADVARIYEDNLIGTRALLEGLPTAPGRFVFVSTVDVYRAPRDGETISEASPLGPEGLYGASKLFCEQLVGQWARGAGCPHAILRYGHIFGPGEAEFRKLIPETIRRLLRGEAPVLTGGGRAERDYLYVGDAVEATVRAGTTGRCDLGPINVVRGESRPIAEVVALLARLAGYGGAIESRDEAATGRSLRFDASRMHEALGTWPLVSLEEGLAREVEAMRDPHAGGGGT